MTDALNIKAGEHETLRVFALDLSKKEAEALMAAPLANGTASPISTLFGVKALDRSHVEVFPTSDLTGIGLSGYITEGLGVDPTDIVDDRDTLDAEIGYIVILHSSAFDGQAVTLAPQPSLRHLGTYRLAQADPPALSQPAVAGDTPAAAPQDKEPGVPPRLPRTLALLGLLGAAIIVLAVSFMIGASNR